MSTHSALNLSKTMTTGLALAAALGFLSGGFIGVLASRGFSATKTEPTIPNTTATDTPGNTGTSGTATSNAFTVGQTSLLATHVQTLQGKSAVLAKGSRGTVVMAMASWCRFCGYEDKWVLPQLVKTSGVIVDIVDVSPQGGIADPGPETPLFSGHDGHGGALTLSGMESIMHQYAATYGILNAPSIHLYIAPSATQTAWNIASFPTLAFLNAQGTVEVAPQGAQTLSQAQYDLQRAIG